MKKTLHFPLSAMTAQFLFDTIEDPMTVFISEVLSDTSSLLLVTLAAVFTLALFARTH